jgi:hypothetical protein
MIIIMGKFSSYSSKAVVSNLLPVGEHRVKCIQGIETDSFTSHAGEKKDKEYPWVNPTDQFLIHVVSVEGKGSLIHRLQGQGLKKFADLTDEEIKSKKYTNLEGYACIKTKLGMERIEDKVKTASCDRIFDRFMNALGAPEGSGLDFVDQAIANKTEFMVIVTNDEYEGKDQLRISGFKPVSAEIKATSDLEA